MTETDELKHGVPHVKARGTDNKTDTIVLVSVDTGSSEISYLSIPQDTWVPHSGEKMQSRPHRRRHARRSVRLLLPPHPRSGRRRPDQDRPLQRLRLSACPTCVANPAVDQEHPPLKSVSLRRSRDPVVGLPKQGLVTGPVMR